MAVQINRNYRNRLKSKEYTGFGIVYMCKCKLNNKLYIGQTIRSLKERISEHYKRGKFYLSNAIKKYGVCNFEWNVLEVCDSQDEMNKKERFWIEHYKSAERGKGYNLKIGGQYGIYNEETRKRMSENMKGKRNHRFGKLISEETRLKMSTSHKNNPSIHSYKSLTCNESGEVFDSIKQASDKTKIPIRTLHRIISSGIISKKYKISFKYTKN